MNKLIRKTLLAALLLAALPAAQAAVQNYNFNGTLDSGAYSGQNFSGSFSFDDAGLSGVDTEYSNLLSFNMSFLGSAFSLANATPFANLDVTYVNGAFLGVSYSADTTSLGFSLTPGYDHVSTAFLAYTTTAGSGIGGAGSLAFTQAVPEPESYAMLLAGLGLMGCVARRRAKAA
jgi:hypothetical protein